MKHTPYYTPGNLFSYEIKKTAGTSLFIVSFTVLLVHLLLVVASFYSPRIPNKREAEKKIVVKTVKLSPKIQSLAPISSPLYAKEIEKNEETPVAKSPVTTPLPEIKPDPIIAAVEVKEPTVPPPVQKSVAQPAPVIEKKTKVEGTEIKKQPTRITPSPPKETPKIKEEKKNIPKPKPLPTAQKLPDKTSSEKPKTNTTAAPVKKPIGEEDKEKNERIQREAKEKLLADEKIKRQKLLDEELQKKLAKARESLAMVEQSGDKIRTSMASTSDTVVGSIPSMLNMAIDALPVGTTIPAELSVKEMNYRDEVYIRLKRALALPEHGSGIIKLTLNRSGKVDGVEMIKTESAKNGEYILQKTSQIIFPPFENRFANAQQYTFIIQF
jgi:hypothetical protein